APRPRRPGLRLLQRRQSAAPRRPVSRGRGADARLGRPAALGRSFMRIVTLLPGDGIGPEVTAATVRVLEAAGGRYEWDSHMAGAEALAARGNPLPQDVLDSILATGVALKGPVTTPIGTGFQSVNVQLRRALDLYANLRPV